MHAIFNKGQSMGRYTQFCRRLDPKFVLLSFLLLCTTLFLSARASALPSDARRTCTETDQQGLKIPVAMFASRGFAISGVNCPPLSNDEYTGASSNYDGTGRNASDNDTQVMFVWTAI